MTDAEDPGIIPAEQASVEPNRAVRLADLPLRVLLIGRDEATLRMMAHVLSRQGRQSMIAHDPAEAHSVLSDSMPDGAIIDVSRDRHDDLDYVVDLRKRFPDLGIAIVTDDSSDLFAERAVTCGIDFYLHKPIAPWALDLAVKKISELREHRQRVVNLQRELTISVRDAAFPDIVTNCDAMKAVLRLVEKVSSRDLSVLICGESGTGKELVARAVHQSSPRHNGPFIELNCAALPPNLVESELFGHEKGAFTGAIASRAGKIEQACGGTLFLDEIGELPLEIQPKLLRALQERRVTRIGGRGLIESDFRLVCATNRDLVQEVKAGRFREDLFYRVAVFPVQLPPLRDRLEDLELLLGHFLTQEGATFPECSPEAMSVLRKYNWPGNVRELKNFAQAIVLLTDGARIDESAVQSYFGTRLALPSGVQPASRNRPVRRLDDLERDEIDHAMSVFKGNVPEAARALGMGRATLYKYLNRTATQMDD